MIRLGASFFTYSDISGGVADLRLSHQLPAPNAMAALTPAAARPNAAGADSALGEPLGEPLGERDNGTAADIIVGVASMYNPADPGDNDAGGWQTASGERYDPTGWTAAIRTDLRERFGGVRYGKNYQPAYALVESGDKRVIVKINDVGPLKPGRIIDFNERAMRFFDSTLKLGLIHDVRVTPLSGTHWAGGPVGGERDTVMLAGDFSR